MRIKAFSLLEMTMALLLSSIVIAMSVSAYIIVSKKVRLYEKKLDTVTQLSRLHSLILMDFENAKIILKKNEQLSFINDSNEIIYKFDNSIIIREQSSRVDSFFVNFNELSLKEESNFSYNIHLVSEVSFTTHVFEPIEMKFFKKYSAADIINYGRD